MPLEDAATHLVRRPGEPSEHWFTMQRFEELLRQLYTDMGVADVDAAVQNALQASDLGPLVPGTVTTGAETRLMTAQRAVGDVNYDPDQRRWSQWDGTSWVMFLDMDAVAGGVTEEGVQQAITDALSELSAQPFDADNPIVVAEPLVEESSGQPIGLSADGQTFHQPEIVGGIPVVVDGKQYLIPLIER